MNDNKQPDTTIDPTEWAATVCKYSDSWVMNASIIDLFDATISKFEALYPERLSAEGLRWEPDFGMIVSTTSEKAKPFEAMSWSACVFCRRFREWMPDEHQCSVCPINVWASTPCYEMHEYRTFGRTGDPSLALGALRRMRHFYRRHCYEVVLALGRTDVDATNEGGTK